LLDRSAGETLAAVCAPIGVSILPYGVLARGLLSGKYSSGEVLPAGSRAESSATLRSDLTPERLAAAQPLAEVAARSGRSSVSLACAWILAQRGVPACIVGVRTPEQLREIVAAADIAFEESEAQEIASFVNDGRKT
jgi:aryl-alcohol dehydrogenase-like predicted oxidoreductase